jgi:hypothetical protein
MKRLLVTVFASVAVLGASASAASAYTHNWGPNYYPADTRYYDSAGATYNPFRYVLAESNTQLPEICSKAVTQAGNLRSSTTGYCNYNYASHDTEMSGGTPETNAYIYWNGATGSRSLTGHAGT